jgi:Holliday junction resolvase-like predicted endonuclease
MDGFKVIHRIEVRYKDGEGSIQREARESVRTYKTLEIAREAADALRKHNTYSEYERLRK